MRSSENILGGSYKGLQEYVFSSLAQVQLSAFLQHDKSDRPHRRPGYLTLVVFKKAWLEAEQNCRILTFSLD